MSLILETRWRQAEARVSNQKSMLESLERERERSVELQRALQEQLDVARRGPSEVSLLQEQLQMVQQAVLGRSRILVKSFA